MKLSPKTHDRLQKVVKLLWELLRPRRVTRLVFLQVLNLKGGRLSLLRFYLSAGRLSLLRFYL